MGALSQGFVSGLGSGQLGLQALDTGMRAQEARFRAELQPLLKQQLQRNVDMLDSRVKRDKKLTELIDTASEEVANKRAKRDAERAKTEKAGRAKVASAGASGLKLSAEEGDAFATLYADARDAGDPDEIATQKALAMVKELSAGGIQEFLSSLYMDQASYVVPGLEGIDPLSVGMHPRSAFPYGPLTPDQAGRTITPRVDQMLTPTNMSVPSAAELMEFLGIDPSLSQPESIIESLNQVPGRNRSMRP